jgi:hypothetical protein
VTSRKSFAIFLHLLLQDLIENKDSPEWENPTLERFLEAMSSWVESAQNNFDNLNLDVDADIPTWELFAEIFRAAKVYE